MLSWIKGHTNLDNANISLRSSFVLGVLKDRRQAALNELAKIIEDSKEVPVNYNHYYTKTVHQKRQERIKSSLLQYVPQGSTTSIRNCSVGAHYPQVDIGEELDKVVRRWAENITPDMEEFSIQEALDCLMAIYKVIEILLPLILSEAHIILNKTHRSSRRRSSPMS